MISVSYTLYPSLSPFFLSAHTFARITSYYAVCIQFPDVDPWADTFHGFCKGIRIREYYTDYAKHFKAIGPFVVASGVPVYPFHCFVFMAEEFLAICGNFAAILSQILISFVWQNAKFGTIANVMIIIAGIVAFGGVQFKTLYRNDVINGLKNSGTTSLLTLADIDHLPAPVKKYIIYSNSVGKPKVNYFYIEFTGQLRKNNQSSWMPFVSEQYNFMNDPARLFFLDATMYHLPVSGYHRYKNGEAFMDIRLFSLFKVQYQEGNEMGISETVTFFNDMCCLAPATLIDKRIEWGEVKGNSVEARFTVNDISISAVLYFNDEGQLVNFISHDRYAQQDDGTMKRLPWSTPLGEYKEINGYHLTTAADAVYTYPEGNFCYGNFRVRRISYNSK